MYIVEKRMESNDEMIVQNDGAKEVLTEKHDQCKCGF